MSCKHQDDKIIAFERNNLLFVFNFHSTKSFTDYRVGVDVAGAYQIILSTDDELFGGFNRIDKNCKHITDPLGHNGRRNFVQVSNDCRAALPKQNLTIFFSSNFSFICHAELPLF